MALKIGRSEVKTPEVVADILPPWILIESDLLPGALVAVLRHEHREHARTLVLAARIDFGPQVVILTEEAVAVLSAAKDAPFSRQQAGLESAALPSAAAGVASGGREGGEGRQPDGQPNGLDGDAFVRLTLLALREFDGQLVLERTGHVSPAEPWQQTCGGIPFASSQLCGEEKPGK